MGLWKFSQNTFLENGLQKWHAIDGKWLNSLRFNALKFFFLKKHEICIGGKFSLRTEKKTVGFSFFLSYIKTAVISKILMRLPWNFEYLLTSCFSASEPKIMIVNCREVACTSLPSNREFQRKFLQRATINSALQNVPTNIYI